MKFIWYISLAVLLIAMDYRIVSLQKTVALIAEQTKPQLPVIPEIVFQAYGAKSFATKTVNLNHQIK